MKSLSCNISGMFATPAKLKLPDQNLNSELTEQLFRTAHAVALDLAAMNIQRGRDHAIPGYLEWRAHCNLSSASNFDDLAHVIKDPKVRQKLRSTYGHPGNMDVWLGGILEDQLPGAKVGPLFKCLLLEQFERMRDGDRFWYENPNTFRKDQLDQIRRASLAKVLCDNADNVTRIQRNVFLLPEGGNDFVDCEDIPSVDLRVWSDCCEECGSDLGEAASTRSKRGLYLRPWSPSRDFDASLEEDIANVKGGMNDLKERIRELEANVEKLKMQMSRTADGKN